MALITRICKALYHPQEWLLAGAVAAAERDWARDAGRAQSTHIAQARFEDALFETVDLWTTSTDADEYLVPFTQVTPPVELLVAVQHSVQMHG